ncbi:FAD-binding oxidoreductase [Neorhizobium sp. DAR64861/K0K2]|uniref:FAD-binding oxidoreductase n=1 Tax=unclassified Neorhizobium TaxID=2629175 RepID=UPI003D2C8F17
MIDRRHIDALGRILCDKGMLTDEQDIAPYQTGIRFDRGVAALVLRPRSTEEVSDSLAYCVGAGIAVVPQSGNTGVVSGSTPDQSGNQVVLSLDRVTQVFELDVDNRSLRVGAGMRLSEVNRRLEPHGLFFPIDLGADPAIGGMLATNTGGSRFLKYGDVRRNTLGLTAVMADADGTVVDLGKDLRKNNTGLDWKQVFIGTFGVFGIVTEAVLNLEQMPQQSATAYLVPQSAVHVMPLLRMMEDRLGAYLSAFEGMSGNSMRAALAHFPSLRNPFQGGVVPDYTILMELSRTWKRRDGEEALEDVLNAVLAEIWESAEAPLADALVGPAHEMWAMRHALSEGVKHAGKLTALDVSFRRGEIMNFCERMKRDMPVLFPETTICDFGHIADGGVHLNVVVSETGAQAADPTFQERLRDWVFKVAVEEFGGSFSAEHGIGRKNQAYYDLYTPDTLKRLARGLKAVTSPGEVGVAKIG